MESETYDLIVVGAGLNGLTTSRTYLDVNPLARVLILESSSTVGGTWAKDRLYAGLKTNNLEGGYEFADFPMRGEARYNLKHDQHIPGTTMNQYMQDFADHFGLSERTRLKCKVHTIERLPDESWSVGVDDQGIDTRFHSRKIVLATGFSSRPFIPYFEGQESFNAPILHVKDLSAYDSLPATAQSVTLLNVTKSAYDVAYACATKGVQVNWIVRKSGHGPVVTSVARVTPLKKRLEDLTTVRFLSWFSPCIWSDAEGSNWMRWFLQHTKLGRKLVSALWTIIDRDVVERSGYDKHPETAKLKHRYPAVWYACALGILNFDTDFTEYVRNGTIKIYEDDISHLSSGTVHLTSGTSLPSSALVCSTGWDHRPSINFVPASLPTELGLPSSSSPISPALTARADAEILRSLPWLVENCPPTLNPNFRPLPTTDPTTKTQTDDTRTQPYRLYRFLAPPTHVGPHNPDPTVAFVGFTWAVGTCMLAQVAALWVTAYLGGQLPQQQPLAPPSAPTGNNASDHAKAEQQRQERVLYETALHTQFPRWRYPLGFGHRFPDMVFDTVPYVDLLMRDLGLETRRKKGWGPVRWYREWWEHYSVKDYVGVVGEWLGKERRGGRERSWVKLTDG
ncbi:uncharacterized protein HMPREF1541_04182 [Cyphellophora europaea CBS 101466]|uniref:FAD/NAD(P)-binding domain-containing protein n=1 Tax=Cyphellophora europaea (strain CBS 101466) TaxID=1220924 RepID=W2S0I2_CYPE1|nr:uncharacterized protein HMPREF1541_04182 [Cyphellophora europaea CBS 101466]ETN42241.1 hypothetical protein HMPREF1541_04182 [Cyphellophora europaea CBS 101466]